MELAELPESWSVNRLVDLCEIRLGKTPARGNRAYWEGDKPWVSIRDLNDEVLTQTKEGISETAIRECGCKIVSTGTLLFSFKLTIGKMAFAGAPIFTNEAIAALPVKPGVKLEPKFLFYALKVVPLLEGVSDAAKGMTLNKQSLAEIQIPVPPLEEQRRIVARVEVLTRRLDQARQARQAALTEAETVLPSAVDSVFAERNGEWETATVEELCGKPQYGYTESANASPVGPRFVRITDIQDGRVDWENVPYCQCNQVDKYRLQTGDILFARTGATTGKSFLVDDPPEAVFASYLIRVRRGQRILPEFLWWYFQSGDYWTSVFAGIDDGNRPNMNGSKLAALEIPFPKSLTMQRAIVARLDALRGKLDELQRLQREVAAELASFTPALLAKAFRGEL